jgi:hypothetical protein
MRTATMPSSAHKACCAAVGGSDESVGHDEHGLGLPGDGASLPDEADKCVAHA